VSGIKELKIDITAVIVSSNEGHLLGSCLKQLDFCNEIIVFDLQSTDNTREVALKYGARVIDHERISIVEIIHSKLYKYITTDWILITDPDEILRIELKTELIQFLSNAERLKKIGAISVPLRFYFKSKLLKGTRWGGINYRIYVVHKNRFTFSNEVHRGRNLNNEFENYNIKYSNNNYIEHYWMQSYKQLFEKHKRYIEKEGESRYNNGQRALLKTIIFMPYRAFKDSFISRRGYLDFFTGFFLSLFWAWYETMSNINLYDYQRKFKSKKIS
jgi:glycosyltransferase involved in cell wall biosynthesis